MSNKLLIVLAAVIALIVGILSRGELNTKSTAAPDLVAGTWLQPAKVIDDFELQNQFGEIFNNKNLEGKWTILFFGFINCPDICPTTLKLLKNIKADLTSKQSWGNKQVVFVTVDPVRDTQDKIAPYIGYFDKEFIGVRGDFSAISAFAKDISMPFVHEEKNEFGGYNVSHSASLVVMNPKGQLAAIFSAPHDHSKIAYDLLGAPFSGSP